MLDLNLFNKDKEFNDIYNKIINNIPISDNDAVYLFNSNDLLSIGMLANLVSYKKHKNNVTYIHNCHINYSNVCAIRCSFCSFRRSLNNVDSYTLSKEQILETINSFEDNNIDEVHIVGGLHPTLKFEYYLEIIDAIHKSKPNITIKAFTAVEIEYFSSLYNMEVKEVLKSLSDIGLKMMPGGGAEIFKESIRRKICPTKISGEQWIDIHNIAHQNGIKTNATMLFGHIESYEDRVHHLSLLRNSQDKFPGYISFIPLTYHPDNNPLRAERTSVIDELKTIAISRIYLNNFDNIKAYWVMLEPKIAQIALNFGANDIDGTIYNEKIYYDAGSKSGKFIKLDDLKNIIKQSGKIAIRRDSFNNYITT